MTDDRTQAPEMKEGEIVPDDDSKRHRDSDQPGTNTEEETDTRS